MQCVAEKGIAKRVIMELQSLPNGMWQDVGSGRIIDDATARRMIVSGTARRAVQSRAGMSQENFPTMPDVPYGPAPAAKKKSEINPIVGFGIVALGFVALWKFSGGSLGLGRKRK